MSECIRKDALHAVLPLVTLTCENKCLCSPSVAQKGDTGEQMETHCSAHIMQNIDDEAQHYIQCPHTAPYFR